MCPPLLGVSTFIQQADLGGEFTKDVQNVGHAIEPNPVEDLSIS